MRVSCDFEEYELLDASEGERLERWKDIILIRPDPQIIWNTEKTNPFWQKAHARYIRSQTGGGRWESYKKFPDAWNIRVKDMIFQIKTMGFKHTGLFPEQLVNWDLTRTLLHSANRPLKVLNLFAYTGGATVACLMENAEVVHVDASKGMVEWAKENARLSGVANRKIRWIVDDCIKFVEREIRRGSRYDVIIMDPPSYGRGPGGEVWKLEDEIYRFVSLCGTLLSDTPLLFMLNSYTTGLSASVMEYILSSVLKGKITHIRSDEIGLPVTSSGLILPCGATAYATLCRKGIGDGELD